MKETMQYWADNYQLGIGLITGILILIYTAISIGAILLYRYRKGYISACTLWVNRRKKNRKRSKKLKMMLVILIPRSKRKILTTFSNEYA